MLDELPVVQDAGAWLLALLHTHAETVYAETQALVARHKGELPVEMPTVYVTIRGFSIVSPWLAIPLAIFFFFPIRLAILCITKVLGRIVGSDRVVEVKMGESIFKFLYYAVTWLICVSICYKQDLWPNKPANLWKGWPQEMPFEQQAYYLIELAFYVSSLIAMPLLETVRKDFLLMTVHHVFTITLILGSYVFDCQHTGLAVLLAHNISDVFLEGAKICKYANFDMGANVVFFMFFLSWVYYRLWMLPTNCVWISITHDVPIPFVQRWIMTSFLVGLQIMHWFWFVSIVRVLRKALRGEIDDVRESDLDDEAAAAAAEAAEQKAKED